MIGNAVLRIVNHGSEMSTVCVIAWGCGMPTTYDYGATGELQ
jgi:hypothetical protein